MKPFYVLITVFVLSLLITKIFFGNVDYNFSGKISLSIMLLFTALGHFLFTKGMSFMLPDYIPFRPAIIIFTGVLEILAAIGIFISGVSELTGNLLIIFFIVLLPANIYAAQKHLNYKTGKNDGPGFNYLWFRIPFQILLIAWTYFFVLKK